MRPPFALGLAALVLSSVAAPAQVAGPSTSTPPSLVPATTLPAGSVRTVSLLTVGDRVGADLLGATLGAFGAWSGDGVVTVLAAGRAVSRTTLDPSTRAVISGIDGDASPEGVHVFDPTAGAWVDGTLDRFRSGALAPQSAFQYKGLGTARRIVLGADGDRAFARVATGPDRNQSWELPALGRMPFGRQLASPYSQPNTVVMQLDGAAGITMYVGTKKRSVGNDVERAGLTGGALYAIRLLDDAGRFEATPSGDISERGGVALRADSGAWDPRVGHQGEFYVATTEPAAPGSRLRLLRFDDVTRPERGGRAEVLLGGTEGQGTLDALTVDPLGRVIALEETGRVWAFDTVHESVVAVAAHDPARELRIVEGERPSLIEAFDLLGAGWYLAAVPSREGGQLVALYVDPVLGR